MVVSIEDAYDILKVDDRASIATVKKNYYKLALVHHPDRHVNKSVEEIEAHAAEFKRINEAYRVICECGDGGDDTVTSISLSAILRRFLASITKNVDDADLIVRIVTSHIGIYSLKLFNDLDHDTAMILYKFLVAFADILDIDSGFLEKVREMLADKYRNCVFVKSTIDDLLKHNIYEYVNGDKRIYVPKWACGNDVEYEINGEVYTFIVEFDGSPPAYMPKVDIDENNVITLYYDRFCARNFIRNDLPLFENGAFYPFGGDYCIRGSDLRLIGDTQTVVFEKRGAPKYNPDDPFDDSQCADIVFKIKLRE